MILVLKVRKVVCCRASALSKLKRNAVQPSLVFEIRFKVFFLFILPIISAFLWLPMSFGPIRFS